MEPGFGDAELAPTGDEPLQDGTHVLGKIHLDCVWDNILQQDLLREIDA